jgi:hypothetical protein
MDLAQMEALALDLGQQVADLDGRVSALEDGSHDSFAPQNSFYISEGGHVKEIGEPQQSGIAILENEREPASGDYHKPGDIEFELLRAEGIETDSIGALPTEGEVALPGAAWKEVPTKFVSIGAGKFKGNMTNTPQAGQQLYFGEAPTFKGGEPPSIKFYDLIQLKGTPGAQAEVVCNFAHNVHKNIALTLFKSNGEGIGSVFPTEGGGKVKFLAEQAFPADGILYIVLAREAGREDAIPYEYEVTFSEVNSNPFEFDQFKLPEGFLYIVSAEFEFVTQEAAAFSALMRTQIKAELEPPEDTVQFSNGSLLSASQAAAKIWDLPADAAISLWIPVKQTTVALGGVRVLKPVSAPGNETEYAWSKQKLTIQQITL